MEFVRGMILDKLRIVRRMAPTADLEAAVDAWSEVVEDLELQVIDEQIPIAAEAENGGYRNG